MEDFLRIGRASQQDRGGEDRAQGGQVWMNTHSDWYDHPRRRAAEACLAARKTLVVRNTATAVVVLHEACDARRLGQEKPEGKDREQSYAHEDLYPSTS